MEARVLAHVSQVRRGQADTARAQFARGVRGEAQRQRLAVRIGEAGKQHHVGTGDVLVDRDQRFPVGKMPPGEGAHPPPDPVGDRRGQPPVVRKREHDRGHAHSGPIERMSGLAAA